MSRNSKVPGDRLGESGEGEYRVGSGKPPQHSRFAKGISGNSQGRPKLKLSPHALLWRELSKPISIRLEGVESKVTRLDALFMQLNRLARQGDPRAERLLQKRLDLMRRRRTDLFGEPEEDQPTYSWTEEHERIFQLAKVAADQMIKDGFNELDF